MSEIQNPGQLAKEFSDEDEEALNDAIDNFNESYEPQRESIVQMPEEEGDEEEEEGEEG